MESTSEEIRRAIQSVRRRRYLVESGKSPKRSEYELKSLAAREVHLRKKLLEGKSR